AHQLAVDEVRDAAEEEARGRQGAEQVADGEEIGAGAAGEPDACTKRPSTKDNNWYTSQSDSSKKMRICSMRMK
ncbi:MAG: hypothetical protein RLZZ504_1585, partial [Bacteroidota bacterium]